MTDTTPPPRAESDAGKWMREAQEACGIYHVTLAGKIRQLQRLLSEAEAEIKRLQERVGQLDTENQRFMQEVARLRTPSADTDAMERAREIVPDGIITEAAQYLPTTRAAVEKKLQQDIAAALVAERRPSRQECADEERFSRLAKCEISGSKVLRCERDWHCPWF